MMDFMLLFFWRKGIVLLLRCLALEIEISRICFVSGVMRVVTAKVIRTVKRRVYRRDVIWV